MNDEWRSTRLQLPEDEGYYICSDGYGGMFILYCTGGGKSAWWEDEEMNMQHNNIEFWMSTPSHPNVHIPEKKQ